MVNWRPSLNRSHKNFYVVLLATDVSFFGSFLTYFSMPLIIYSWCRSGMFLAIFELTSLLPSLFLGIFAGLWLRDKDMKKAWMVSSLILGALTFVVFLYVNIWSLLLLNISAAVLSVITAISYQSMLTGVLKKEDFPWGNSMIALSMSALAILAPLPAAFMLDFSVSLPFLIDSVSFFMAVLLVAFIPINWKTGPTEKKDGFYRAFKCSLEFLKQRRTVRNTLLLLLLTTLITGGVKIVNVAYFSSFPSYYVIFGTAMMSLYVGDALAKLGVSLKLLIISRPYQVLVLSLAFYVVAFSMLFFSGDLYLILLAFSLIGLGNGFVAPQRVSVIQSNAQKEQLPQTLGIMNTLTMSSRITSVALLGIGLSFLPPRAIYGIMALLILCVFILFYPSTKGR